MKELSNPTEAMRKWNYRRSAFYSQPNLIEVIRIESSNGNTLLTKVEEEDTENLAKLEPWSRDLMGLCFDVSSV
jgi:hypothetical protein